MIRSLRPFVLATFHILVLTGVVGARLVRRWSDQELLDKSELAVIATPTTTHDTKERGGMPGVEAQPVIGVETTFAVITILKGAQTTKMLILHHYRANRIAIINAPTFLSFDLKTKQTFRLYIVREADGRYAPVAGQIDPGLSVREETPK
jgi:hypothetical protein